MVQVDVEVVGKKERNVLVVWGSWSKSGESEQWKVEKQSNYRDNTGAS
jgi:hypothetical protein